MNGAVSQLQVADTLIDEYLSIARRLPQFKLRGEDPQELVDEANRIYLQVWDSLKAARDELAASGRDVSRYDAVRASAGNAVFSGAEGSTDVKVSGVGLLFGDLDVQTAFSYRLNLPGVARAAMGRDALKAVMPEVDWARLAAEAASVEPLRQMTPTAVRFVIGGVFVGLLVLAILLQRAC